MTDFKKLLSAIAVCTVIAAVFITATVSVTARDEGYNKNGCRYSK